MLAAGSTIIAMGRAVGEGKRTGTPVALYRRAGNHFREMGRRNSGESSRIFAKHYAESSGRFPRLSSSEISFAASTIMATVSSSDRAREVFT